MRSPSPARLFTVAFSFTAAAALAQPATDRRFHVAMGALAGSDEIVQTPEGASVALTSSFSLPAASFVPDPYTGKCAFVAFKYTLKPSDQKEILGDRYKAPDPDADDPLVLHPIELQNAAGRLGANSIYLLLSDSDELKDARGLHDCTIVSKDGDRYRGETLNEVSCRDEQGVARKFSQYAGRAAFYRCGPAPARESGKKKPANRGN
ncbi:MAG: hypothetical protein ACRD16_09110 [Thermoanaerobaculia bacterium]